MTTNTRRRGRAARGRGRGRVGGFRTGSFDCGARCDRRFFEPYFGPVVGRPRLDRDAVGLIELTVRDQRWCLPDEVRGTRASPAVRSAIWLIAARAGNPAVRLTLVRPLGPDHTRALFSASSSRSAGAHGAERRTGPAPRIEVSRRRVFGALVRPRCSATSSPSRTSPGGAR